MAMAALIVECSLTIFYNYRDGVVDVLARSGSFCNILDLSFLVK